MRVDGRHPCRPVLSALMLLLPLAALAQPEPDFFPGLDALRTVPAPAPLTLRPRVFGGYGAIVTAAMLTVLYLYRGRAFIVYWIGSWLFIGASLMLMTQGYEDLRLGRVSAVVLGLAQ